MTEWSLLFLGLGAVTSATGADVAVALLTASGKLLRVSSQPGMVASLAVTLVLIPFYAVFLPPNNNAFQPTILPVLSRLTTVGLQVEKTAHVLAPPLVPFLGNPESR